eukprot:7514846-Alexandrium_andersonii.AAC.1
MQHRRLRLRLAHRRPDPRPIQKPTVARAIMTKCKSESSTWRAHPDIPDVPEAKQYWVRVSEDMRKELQRVLEKG